MSIIRQIIDNHSVFFTNNTFEIVDPESKLYNIDVLGRVRSQEEIINCICKSGSEYDYVDFRYNNELELRYNYKDNKINLIPLDINSVHLIRLLGIKKIPKYNLELDIQIEPIYFSDILFEINIILDKNKLLALTDYCTICSKPLKLKSLGKIQCCDDSKCLLESKIKVLDNRITDNYNKDPELTEFLIQVLILGTIHPKQEKIFKPLPSLPGITSLEKLKTKLDEEETKDNFNIFNIKESKTDIELYRKIGSDAYGIINNAISDNYFLMSTIKNFSTEVLDLQRLRLPSENKSSVFDSEQIKFIGFNYSYEIESTFKKENFLFHGTPLYSWYPIIKNGLRIMSGTEFQANGAVYGSGIYLSDSFQFSLGYSRDCHQYTNTNNKTKRVVGIFEINDDIEKFKKASSIYVINDDKIMLLRYLVIVENNSMENNSMENNLMANYQEITDYFFKYLGKINKTNEKKSLNIKNKRLSGEMKILNANTNILDIKIIDECKNWVIELKEIKEKKIKLIIYFNDYPRLPPKITIESDIDKKKIISDDSNNLILPELNPSKWDDY